MKKICLGLVLLSAVFALRGGEYAVIQNWHIILPEKPGNSEKFAAEELKLHLQRSYTRPARFNGKVPEKINLFVGMSPAARQSGFTDVVAADKLPGKFGIYRCGNNLLFYGEDTPNGRIDRIKDKFGTLSAAEYFLQKYVGVRFFMAGDSGIKYPQDPAVVFDSASDLPVPAYEVRTFQRMGRNLDLQAGSLYFRRRLGSVPIYATQDYYYCFLNNWNKRFQHKKEMFALHEGRRFNGNYPRHFPCLSHPDVIPQVISDINAARKKNPRIKTIRFFADAPIKICECDSCANSPVGKLVQGSDHSELIYSLLCKLARELQKDDPELWFHTHTKGGSYYQPPRTEKLPPHIVMFILTNFFEQPDYAAVKRQCKVWAEAGATVMVKGYPRAPWMKNYPIMNPHLIAGFFKNLQGYSKGSIMCEGRPDVPYTFSALNNYVHSAVVFDTTVDVDALIREFCEFAAPESAVELENFYNSMESLVLNASFNAEPLFNCYISFRLKTPRKHLDAALAKAPENRFLRQLSKDFAAFEKIAAESAPKIRDEEELQTIYRSFENKKAPLILSETPDKSENLAFSIYYDFQKSQTFISRHGKELKVVVSCQEKAMDKLKMTCKNNHSGPVWNDDSIELFIAGAEDSLPYIQLVVNPLGTYRAMYADENGKVSDCRDFPLITAGALRADGWEMEVRVPLEAVARFADKSGNVHLGVYRNRPARGKDSFQQSGVQKPRGNSYKDKSGHFTVKLPAAE